MRKIKEKLLDKRRETDYIALARFLGIVIAAYTVFILLLYVVINCAELF